MSTPPDAQAGTLATRARAEWAALVSAYDAIEQRLIHSAWEDVADLAEELDTHERELAAIMAAVAAAEREHAARDPVLAALRGEMEHAARRLADRLPAILRTATAARDAIAARLARARTGRNQTGHYRGGVLPTARFTSRVV